MDDLWANPRGVVDDERIRWTTLWIEEIPLDLAIAIFQSPPTDSFGDGHHRRVGGGSNCPTARDVEGRFGEGGPWRSEQATATARHGTCPTWEPRVERRPWQHPRGSRTLGPGRLVRLRP